MSLIPATVAKRRPYPPLSEAGRPRVVVTGTRSFDNRSLLFEWMDKLTANMEFPIICTGHYGGTDTLAEQWAESRHHSLRLFHPDWDNLGNRAGPIRNTEMVNYAAGRQPEDPGWCVGFWDGASSGTSDCLEKARRAGLRVKIIRYED